MAKTEVKKKLVTIDCKGSISELGGISGPIVHPCEISLDVITILVNNRKKVYEVNPANRSERVLLTLKNVNTKNFPDVNPKVKANVAPAAKAKVETKEATKTETVKTEAPAKTATTSDFTKK